MHDYNGDGHHDSRDSSLFHNVIMDESGNSKGSGGASKGSSLTSGFSTVIILVIMMIFKPGALFSGFFPGLVWLVCIVILFLKFGCWLEEMTR